MVVGIASIPNDLICAKLYLTIINGKKDTQVLLTKKLWLRNVKVVSLTSV